MEYCYVCHEPDTRVILFEAVMPEGVVKICESCSVLEKVPIIRNSLLPSDKLPQQTVNERMRRMSGIDKKDYNPNFEIKPVSRQDFFLKRIAEGNFRKNVESSISKDELIDNFHWAILRSRRALHLSQAQLGAAIHETETSIKSLEQGNPPRNFDVIDKLERFLNVRLRKDYKKSSTKPSIFDTHSIKEVTISTLKEIKNEQENNPQDIEEVEPADLADADEDYEEEN